MKKHFDNKDDLLRTLKKNSRQKQYDTAAAFSANMLMSLYVLRIAFDFGTKRAEAFVDAMAKVNGDIESGELTIDQIQTILLDELGIQVELPN